VDRSGDATANCGTYRVVTIYTTSCRGDDLEAEIRNDYEGNSLKLKGNSEAEYDLMKEKIMEG
jgi:hypothetical protein